VTRTVAIAICTLAITAHAASTTERATGTTALAASDGQRHHYTIGARVRPLLFWIGKDDVGDAVLAKKQDPELVRYALLIGSDPARARGINRWGYLSEEIRGDEVTVVGLMTESDEDSVEQAETNLRKQAGDRTFNIIRTSIAGSEARSVVTSVAAPSTYTFRNVDALLGLADQTGSEGKTRVARLPAGARPGFLAALANLIHLQVSDWHASGLIHPTEAIAFVYHGKVYHLRVTKGRAVSEARVGGATYQHVIASQFQVISEKDGETTEFSMTYAADGPFAETPLTATYQPRWWIEIQLTLDDSKPGPALVSESNP
jgi:hypothetical protein